MLRSTENGSHNESTCRETSEGVYLATSDDLPGLVAQGRTVAETLYIARDVARKLIDARRERESGVPPRKS